MMPRYEFSREVVGNWLTELDDAVGMAAANAEYGGAIKPHLARAEALIAKMDDILRLTKEGEC